MTAALIDSDGVVRPLDGKAPARAVFTAEDAKDPEKVARLISGLLDDVAELRRRYAPRWVDFEDVAVDALGTTFSLEHGFGGRVRWWVSGWQTSGATGPDIREDTSATTATAIALKSYNAGTATIRVESVDG